MESLLGLLRRFYPSSEVIIVVEPIVEGYVPKNAVKLGEVKAQDGKIYEIYATAGAIYVLPLKGISPMLAYVQGIFKRAREGDKEAQKLLPLVGLYPSYIGTKLRIIPLEGKPIVLPVEKLKNLFKKIKNLYIETIPYRGRLGHGESYRWYLLIHQGSLNDLVRLDIYQLLNNVVPLSGRGIILLEDRYIKYSNGEVSSSRLSRKDSLAVLNGLASQSIISRSSLYSALVNMLQNDVQLRLLYGESSPLLEEALKHVEQELEKKHGEKISLAKEAFTDLFVKAPRLVREYDKYLNAKVSI